MLNLISRRFTAFIQNDKRLSAGEYACVLAIIMIASIVSVTILSANAASTDATAATEISTR